MSTISAILVKNNTIKKTKIETATATETETETEKFLHNEEQQQFLWQLKNFWWKMLTGQHSKRRRRKRNDINVMPPKILAANDVLQTINVVNTNERAINNNERIFICNNNTKNNNNNNNNDNNKNKNNNNKSNSNNNNNNSNNNNINNNNNYNNNNNNNNICHKNNKLMFSNGINNYSISYYTILNKLTRTFLEKTNNTKSTTIPNSSSILYIIIFLTFCTMCSLSVASPCDTQSWWDPVKDKCILCTVCTGDMIPLRPCQLHRDTICGSIYDLKIDWVVLAKTEPNWKERRKTYDNNDYNLEQNLTPEQLQQLHEEAIPLDWQTAALFFAVLACLLFFIIAACILIHHMRQWRRMERRLDKDVEELSTKLMAKLAEVQSLEGGTFFIGNADALRVQTTFQPQHVLLPITDKSGKHQQHHHHHHPHHHERRIIKTLQPGNVYIEENGSKG